MTPAPPVQRETVALISAFGTAWLRARSLSASDEGRKPIGIAAVFSRSRVLRLLMTRLMLLLIAIAVVRLSVARGIRLLARRVRLLLAAKVATTSLRRLLILALFNEFVSRAAVGLRLVIRICLPELLLGSRDDAEVMLGVLVVILGRHRVARSLRVAGELQILFRDRRRGATDLHLRAIRLVHPRQRILTFALVVMLLLLLIIPPAHPLVLTVSHGSPVANS
jgi:hypothetical protein